MIQEAHAGSEAYEQVHIAGWASLSASNGTEHPEVRCALSCGDGQDLRPMGSAATEANLDIFRTTP